MRVSAHSSVISQCDMYCVMLPCLCADSGSVYFYNYLILGTLCVVMVTVSGYRFVTACCVLDYNTVATVDKFGNIAVVYMCVCTYKYVCVHVCVCVCVCV